MLAVLQRVNSAQVISDGEKTGSIEKGLVILLGVKKGDTAIDAELLAEKISKTRIFADENDKMNLSLKDIHGGALIVSNFTLCANYAHGNRPDYMEAEKPPLANELYEKFVSLMRERIDSVGTGVFGAYMNITMETDGPITIVMDSEVLKKKGK